MYVCRSKVRQMSDEDLEKTGLGSREQSTAKKSIHVAQHSTEQQ